MPQILPDFSSSVKLKYVKLGYQYLVNHILTFLLIPIIATGVVHLLRIGPYELNLQTKKWSLWILLVRRKKMLPCLKEDDPSDFQRNETHEDQSGPVEDHSKVLMFPIFHSRFLVSMG